MDFDVKFSEIDSSFDSDFGAFQIITVGANLYEGEYNITPTPKARILPTKDKLMRNDFTILAIPYAEVTNLANGITVIIADNN